jgi:hypothetical protein
MISHTSTGVLLRNESLDERAVICFRRASELTLHLLQVLDSSLTIRDCPPYPLLDPFFDHYEALAIRPLPVDLINLIAAHELAILLLSLGLSISTEVIGNI